MASVIRYEQAGRPQGGRAAVLARRRRTFIWRRTGLLLVVAGLGAVGWSGGQKLVAGATERPGAGTGCPRSQDPVPAAAQELGEVPGACGLVVTARPGDTVWALAVRYAGHADPRRLEDVLQAEVPGGVLQPGQALVVPLS